MLAYGRYGTLLARIIHETITAWFNTLCDYLSRGNHIDVIRAWSKAHKTLKNSRKNAEYSNAGTRGLMSNVISMLLNLGWYPTAYNVWEDPVTGTWTLTDASVAPHVVIRKLIDSSHTNRLAQASLHHNGEGMQKGVDWNCTLSYSRSLNSPADYNHKCALETIMCGATWSNNSVSQIHSDVEDICARCGNPGDTDFHTLWECQQTII